MANVLPLNPQMVNLDNICKENSKGIPISIKSKDIAMVFKWDGSKQCEEENGISPKAMSKNLKKLNIKVLRSASGYLRLGRQLPSCGQPTNRINIFYLPMDSKQRALEKGYKDCFNKNNQ